MALSIGTQLGLREITALLGKVCMGDVDRARDLLQRLLSCFGEHERPDH